MIADTMIRAAAVGGVAAMWSYFMLKTFKICKQIVFPPEPPKKYRCVYCGYFFTGDFVSDRRGVDGHFYVCKHCEEKEDVCVRCGERFTDDEALYGEEKNENPLCKICI